ncbi:hypothetical protein K1719_004730 [Acacia pycnantha]|nr:hypothetical protein K1719_004730 [Acacia pycnantha]
MQDGATMADETRKRERGRRSELESHEALITGVRVGTSRLKKHSCEQENQTQASGDSGAKIVTLDVYKAKNLIQSDHVYLDVNDSG